MRSALLSSLVTSFACVAASLEVSLEMVLVRMTTEAWSEEVAVARFTRELERAVE